MAKKQTPPHPHRIRIQVFQLIEAKLGKLAVRDLTATAVRAWFAGLDSSKPTRNGHAYAILNMICNTAIKDGLVDRKPVRRAWCDEPKGRKQVKIPTTVELHGIADKLGTDERTSRFRALVLLAGWCGMRFGEVTELRRRDFAADCTVVTISRGVTHRADPNTPGADRCRIDTTKNGEQRTVTIPPHIRDDAKARLSAHVALVFAPVRGGCHLNDRVFNQNVFRKSANDVGKEDFSVRGLRPFAGSKNAQMATLTENMARLGHKTVGAAVRYQHSEAGRDAIIANALPTNAIAELQNQRR